MIILGSGPNRIGQGIEFDYCCCHAVFGFKAEGFETVMINCNPETVSTDYDTADRLYFEPLTFEDVMAVIERERDGNVDVSCVVQFGGQTPLKLALALQEAGRHDSRHLAGLDRPGRRPPALQPAAVGPRHSAAGQRHRDLARPRRARSRPRSASRWWCARRTCSAAARWRLSTTSRRSIATWSSAVDVSHDRPILIDRFLEHAKEIDVDCVADETGAVVIGGIMEHIEEAGIHSGDSSCVVPPPFLSDRHIATIRDYSRRIARALKVVGLMNAQYAIKDDTVYVLEVNPRASRTAPYLSKATGVPLPQIAARVMAGKSLADLGRDTTTWRPVGVFVKSPVFPFVRFPGVDTILGPEMKSTGEVMGGADSFGMAFIKAMLGAGQRLPEEGAVCITVNNEDKGEVLPIAQGLAELGFQIIGTRGTAAYLRAHGVDCSVVYKVNEGRPSLADEIVNRKISMVINTPHGRESFFDDKAVRRAAMMAGVPCITTITGAAAALAAITALRTEGLDVRALQDYYAAVAADQ